MQEKSSFSVVFTYSNKHPLFPTSLLLSFLLEGFGEDIKVGMSK
jgi:hypothetical protein